MLTILNKTYHKLFRPIFHLFKRKRVTPVSLPADDAFLPNMDVQWWYWTGHLNTEDGKRFGFEIVFFAFDSWGFFKNILSQASITDGNGKNYQFNECLSLLKLPKKIKNRFELSSKKNGLEVISASGGNGVDQLKCVVDKYTLEIDLSSKFEPTLHYDGKRHDYCYGGNTFYYSREKMETKGTISYDGSTYNLAGSTWFDRQYGELYQSIFKGWQWFAIELHDGTNIMVYDYRKEYAANENFASITKENTSEVYKDFTVDILGEWKSPHTGINYPQGWNVKVADYEMIIQPIVADQELRAKHVIWVGPEYWEGDCTILDVYGNNIGDAYVELNGYGNKVFSFTHGVGV